MKISKFALLTIALVAIGFALTSCNNNKSNKTVHSEQQGKEYTSAYVCPMHCEGSGSAEPGNCPVCGMDYVKNNTYACPMHPEVTGIEGDSCSKCGMDLTPISGEDHSGHNH